MTMKKQLATMTAAITIMGAVLVAVISVSVIATNWESTKSVTVGSND